jgi:hypothetical protein
MGGEFCNFRVKMTQSDGTPAVSLQVSEQTQISIIYRFAYMNKERQLWIGNFVHWYNGSDWLNVALHTLLAFKFSVTLAAYLTIAETPTNRHTMLASTINNKCTVACGAGASIIFLDSSHCWGPPGLLLGPSLFLIHVYIIDLVDAASGCFVRFFADDTILYMKIKSSHDVSFFQCSSDCILAASIANDIKFTYSKCNIILDSAYYTEIIRITT